MCFLILFDRNQEHFTNSTIDSILGLTSANILSRLRSLIDYENEKHIRFYHTSFRDFLTTPGRGREWLPTANTKRAIAGRCLSVMNSLLHFNMGGLETSYSQNSAVKGLDERISMIIPEYLRYVCLTWTRHLRDAPFSVRLRDELSTFLYDHLLHWFEALSLIKEFMADSSPVSSSVGLLLQDAIAWLPVSRLISQFESF